jgi:hypothetical protein
MCQVQGSARWMWIKRGVDPRDNVSFAKYQGHELRLPAEWFGGEGIATAAAAAATGDGAGVSSKGVDSTGSAIIRGQAKVSTSHWEIHGFRALPSSRYVAGPPYTSLHKPFSALNVSVPWRGI